MKKLREKMKNQGGFTLVEMLIVVAIIAILVAVSIPLVSTSLDDAKDATDKANLRAAKAEATIMYMNDQMAPSGSTATLTDGMYYDNESGKFITLPASPAKYGKTGNHDYITVKVPSATAGEPFSVQWNTP